MLAHHSSLAARLLTILGAVGTPTAALTYVLAAPALGLLSAILLVGAALGLAAVLLLLGRHWWAHPEDPALAYSRLLVTATHELVLFVRARDGHILEANAAAVAAYGYSHSQLLRMSIADLRDPATAATIPFQMQAASTGGLVFETVHRRADGGTFPVEVHSVGADLNGERVLLSIVHDISARRRLEEELAQERQFLHSVLETAGALIVVLEPDGRIVHFNRACAQLAGLTADEARGRLLWELVIPPEDQEAARELFTSHEAGRFPPTGESVWLTRDGHRCVIAWTYTLIGEAGAPHYVVGSGVDLTERIATERRLRAANRTLQTMEAVNHALGESLSEEALLQRVCATLVAHGRYTLAWVGLAHQGDDRPIVPVAAAGEAAPIVPRLALTWSDGERGQSPSARAIREHRPVVVPDVLADEGLRPWHALVQSVGLLAITALPLLVDDQCIGVLSIGAPSGEAFDAAEVELLTELGRDIAYGVVALRARVAQRSAELELRRVLLELEQRVAARTAELSAANAELASELLDRQAVMATLAEREQFIQRVADAVPGVIYLYDLEADRTLYANAGLNAILGYNVPVEGLEELPLRALIHPDDRGQLGAHHERLLTARDGEQRLFEYRVRHADGSWRWLSGRESVFARAADGRAAQILGTALDITERKAAELALSAAHTRLQITVDAHQRRAEELTLLSETSELLHHCSSVEEAYGVISQAARSLFPSSAGVLSIRRGGEPLLEPVLTWGRLKAPLRPFHPEQCWALRGDTIHLVDPTRIAPPCAHGSPPDDCTSLCVPMALPGHVQGLIQLWFPHDPGAEALAWVQQLALWERIATAFARQTALALADLQRRSGQVPLPAGRGLDEEVRP